MSESLLVFVHIPKTAGITLTTILNRHYGDALIGGPGEGNHLPPERRPPNVYSRFEVVERRLLDATRPDVKAVVGHITFGLSYLLPPDARYLTVLRDPVERTLSHYYFMVQPPTKRRAGAGAGFIPPWLPRPTPDLTLAECLTDRGYIPDNLQTRVLCGLVSPYDPLPPDALEQAKRNLAERFAYVGTTERFEEFLALLNLREGWPTVGQRRVNRNPQRPRRDDLAPEELRLVEGWNTLDRELHSFAAEFEAGAIDHAGPELEREVEVLRRAEEGRNRGAADLDRSWPMAARVALALKERELATAHARIKRLTSRLKP